MLKNLACTALFLAANLAPSSARPQAQAQTQPQTTPTPTPQTQKPSDASTAPATFRVAGRVVNSLTGAPVSRAYVAISKAGMFVPDLSRTLRTGPDGVFTFTQIPAGHYSLQARHKGYVEQNYLQHEGYSTAIIVGPNLDSENLVFPLPPEAVISGEVTDEASEPVRNAQMLLFSEDTENGKHGKHLLGQRMTDDEGRYRFGHLKAGNYYLALSASPWYTQYAGFGAGRVVFLDEPPARKAVPRNSTFDVVYPITYYPNATDPAGAAAIHVDAGGTSPADMRLTPIPAMHMNVEVGERSPGTVAQVGVKEMIFGVYENRSIGASYQFGGGSDSEDEEDQEAGRKSEPLVLELGGLRPGPIVLDVTTRDSTGTGQQKSSRSVPVDPTDGQTLDVRGIPQGAVVSGTVKLEGDAPAPLGVHILLGDATTRNSFRADAEKDGTFKFDGDSFTPGVYRLFAVAPGGLELRSIAATGAKVTGHKIEIGGAGDVQLTLTLARGVTGRVKGVVERAGKPAPGLMVVLVPQNLDDSVEYRRDQSDSDGSFSMFLVSPGKYTVVAVDDWQLEWAKPEVIRQFLAAGLPIEVAGGATCEAKVTAK